MNYQSLVEYYTDQGMSAKEIHEKINKDIPTSHIGYSTVTKYRRNHLHGFETDKESKSPGRTPNPFLAERIKKQLDLDKNISARKIAKILDESESTIRYHLTHYMNYKYMRTRWIPHNMTPYQKQARVRLARDLICFLQARKRDGYKFLVTGDESYIEYQFSPKAQWLPSGAKLPTKPMERFSVKKIMLSIFWSIDGIEYAETIPKDQKYNALFFRDHVLTSLIQSEKYLLSRRDKKGYYLHMDNSPVHNAAIVGKFLCEHNIQRPLHPVYSPDLAPSDFWLFGALDGMKNEETFESGEEILDWVRSKFATFTPELIKRVFEEWEARLQKCIELEGDYIE